MSEDRKDITPLPMSEFLRDQKELHSYGSISEKNCRAIQQDKKDILSVTSILPGSETTQEMFNTFLRLKKQNVSNKSAAEEQKAQMILLATTVEKQKKTIANLEQRLKELTVEYEKLKIEREKEEQEDRISIKIFQKALKFYTSHFQYIIEEGDNNQDQCCVIITFVFEGKPSKYPIRFIFDKHIDTLISFDAGSLLTQQQHEILYHRFKETENYLALFTTLRHGALKNTNYNNTG